MDAIDQKKLAFQIVIDRDHKFELALSLGHIDHAFTIAEESQNSQYFKQVGDVALLQGKIQLAIQCFKNCDDLGSLLLIYTSLGLKNELKELGNFSLFLALI